MIAHSRPVVRWLSQLLLLGLALLFLAPLAMMLLGSLKADARVLTDAGSIGGLLSGEFSLQNYRDVFARTDFLRFLFNSLFITSTIVLCGMLVNSLAAYAFARLEWRGRGLLFNAVLALMILPLEAIAVPLFYGISLLGLRDTYTAQILPFIANAFSIYLFYTFFIGLPKELEEAARLDGASTLRIFFSIIVPNAKPVFASVAILSFLMWWGAYLWPLMVTIGPQVRPLPVAIAAFYTLPPLQWGDILAFGVMMVLPVLAVFLLFQRWFVRGVAASGIKG
ncbi:MAG: carbohydrate ABC transporter permease [Candidatus Thiodiazotropha sp.]